MSVYTCLFDLNGEGKYSAIVGTKKFIQTRDQGDNGEPILFDDQIIFNNPGQKVFPGGKAKSEETLIAGALREFGEETGIFFLLKESNTEVTYDRTDFPIHAQPFTHASSGRTLYTCVYIKVSGNLNHFRDIIQQNIIHRETKSDELESVEIIDLQSYHRYRPTDAFAKYCKKYREALSVPRDRTAWIDALTPRTGTIPIQPTDPTTEPDASKPKVLGIQEFNDDCYNMEPLMTFMIANPSFTFPIHPKRGRVYSFFRENENYPSRFSTDWFSAMSERIPDIDRRI